MILCIDTSASQLVLALWDTDQQKLRAELMLDSTSTHGQMLMPAVEFLLEQVPGKLRGLGVCLGPGSFTGLRVGLATTQGLAFSGNLPIVGLSSLEIMAATQGKLPHTVWAIIDARQKMLYAAPFKWQEGELVRLAEDGSASVERLLELVKTPAFMLGSGAEAYADSFNRPGLTLLSAPPPRGEVMARLAVRDFCRGKYISAEELKPNYCRPSDAEARFGLPLEKYNLL